MVYLRENQDDYNILRAILKLDKRLNDRFDSIRWRWRWKWVLPCLRTGIVMTIQFTSKRDDAIRLMLFVFVFCRLSYSLCGIFEDLRRLDSISITTKTNQIRLITNEEEEEEEHRLTLTKEINKSIREKEKEEKGMLNRTNRTWWFRFNYPRLFYWFKSFRLDKTIFEKFSSNSQMKIDKFFEKIERWSSETDVTSDRFLISISIKLELTHSIRCEP